MNLYSRGSVLVDYYLMLNGTIDLDTAEIRNYFHLSLNRENEKMTFANFTVDPASTDFIGQFNLSPNISMTTNDPDGWIKILI